jgi:hypothetical protein
MSNLLLIAGFMIAPIAFSVHSGVVHGLLKLAECPQAMTLLLLWLNPEPIIKSLENSNLLNQ